ncbi:MAG: ABC transporter permease, partial [Candidatus Bathyarchaeia archaeon]
MRLNKLRPSIGLSILILILLTIFAIFEDLICPYDPLSIEFPPMEPPNFKNWFGTDNLGRDVFSRFVAGTRISFVVALTSIFFAAFLGVLLGLVAAYFKKARAIILRIMDAIWAFPMLLLAMALAASLRPGLSTVIIAISLVYTPLFARLVYSQGLSIIEREFILAARAFGCQPFRMLLTHVLPNLAAPVIVQATLTVGTAIVLESSLSFLGVGIQPPT